ncbi:MAG: VanZ family protein [Nanoarchaeota archaeon]|nr:VanZ family protein [Nanoarchaeota archaeon]
MEQKRFFTAILVLYIISLVVFSALPQVSGNRYISKYDKNFHFIEYLLLTLILFKTLSFYKVKYNFLAAFLIASVFVFSTEMMQLFIPARHFSYGDIMFNMIGVLVALFIKWKL